MGGWCGTAERMHNLGPPCQSWGGKGDLSFSAFCFLKTEYVWELTKQLPKLKKLEKQTVVNMLWSFFFGKWGKRDEELELLFKVILINTMHRKIKQKLTTAAINSPMARSLLEEEISTPFPTRRAQSNLLYLKSNSLLLPKLAILPWTPGHSLPKFHFLSFMWKTFSKERLYKVMTQDLVTQEGSSQNRNTQTFVKNTHL